jgi:hypothetical protein
MPSPVAVSGLVVYRYTLPAPPVARMVCGARKVTTSSVASSSAYRPRQRWPGRPSLLAGDQVHQGVVLEQRDVGRARTCSISVFCTAAPVASVTCTMRRALWPPSRVRCNWPSSCENGTPSSRSQLMLSGACSTTKRVAAGSTGRHRPPACRPHGRQSCRPRPARRQCRPGPSRWSRRSWRAWSAPPRGGWAPGAGGRQAGQAAADDQHVKVKSGHGRGGSTRV